MTTQLRSCDLCHGPLTQREGLDTYDCPQCELTYHVTSRGDCYLVPKDPDFELY